MSHIDAYLDACAAFAFEIGPEFSTRIAPRRNKRESRNAEWEQVRHKAVLPMQNVTLSIYRAIKDMHLVCRGMKNTFPFEDPADHEAVDEIFAVGDGVTPVFQLRKVSTVGSFSYEREIYLPRAGATFTDNDAPTLPDYDLLTGLVDFGSSPPAAGHVLRWTGEFDLKVRFDSDYLPFSIDNRTANGEFVMNGSIVLVEVPE